MVKTKDSHKGKGIGVASADLQTAAFTLKVLNHKVRLKILSLIHKNKEISVSKIYSLLELEQSLTSAHLAMLRKANIVKTRREAQNIFYSVNYSRITKIEKGAKLIIG